jgi:D-alanyl-D-alanine carboxypeptidase (penicillin-binding protein 5/6)
MRARRGPAAIAAALVFAAVAGHPEAAAALGFAAGAGHGSGDHAPARAGHGSRHHAPTGLVGRASGRDATQGGAQLASHGTVVNYPLADQVPKLPRVRASAFVIADARTGQVLAARDPHGWYRPASTLKVLTAVSLIPALNPDATVVASHEAATTEPNDVGLKTGLRYKVSGLFRALLTISANDAAVALAQATGSLRRGIALMNAEARRLQARDTVARDPNGLDAPGQHTSAYDEALIARRALAMPTFLRYDQTRSALFEVKPRHRVELVNQNLMLTRYRGDIGGKIGWTAAAGATYVGMARRHHQTLIVTLLHCPPGTEFTYATRLLNWGFAVDGHVGPVGTLVSPLAPRAKPAAPAPQATTNPPARRQPVASGGLSVGPATVAVAFLVLAGLLFTVSVLYTRRSIARSRSGRGGGGSASARGLNRPG